MVKLPACLAEWGTARFARVFKQEMEGVPADALPLRCAMQHGSAPADEPHRVMLIATHETPDVLVVRAGIFFGSWLTGCQCADDPTPVDVLPEYGEVTVNIDRHTAVATFVMVED